MLVGCPPRNATGSRSTRRPSWPTGWRKGGHMTIDDAAQRPPSMDDHSGLRGARPPAGGRGFEGPVECAQALRDALTHAAGNSTRRLCWCDDDFAAWPLGEAGWIEQLTRWARVSGRELVVIARDYTVIERRHPRFAAW